MVFSREVRRQSIKSAAINLTHPLINEIGFCLQLKTEERNKKRAFHRKKENSIAVQCLTRLATYLPTYLSIDRNLPHKSRKPRAAPTCIVYMIIIIHFFMKFSP